MRRRLLYQLTLSILFTCTLKLSSNSPITSFLFSHFHSTSYPNDVEMSLSKRGRTLHSHMVAANESSVNRLDCELIRNCYAIVSQYPAFLHPRKTVLPPGPISRAVYFGNLFSSRQLHLRSTLPES